MTQYWLSFADPDKPRGTQFLGVAIVEELDFIGAIKRAHALGCNPGGEVLGYTVPERIDVPEVWMDRLLTRAEAEQVEAIISGEIQ